MDGHEMITQRMLAKKSPPVHLSYTGNENRLKGCATKTSDDTDRHCAQQNSATSWTADADSENAPATKCEAAVSSNHIGAKSTRSQK